MIIGFIYLVLLSGLLAILSGLFYKLLKWRILKRINESSIALLKAEDILACTLWLAPLYILGLSDKPTGRQMISSYVGKAAHNNHKWAILLARLIDSVARFLGDKPDHCYRAWKHYKGLDQ